MKDQWHDSAFAEAWDRHTLPGNPTRLEQLDILTTIIADLWTEGVSVLELGIGSGQVAEMLLTRRPDLHLVGLDSSLPMLTLAQRRLQWWADHYTLIETDFQYIAWATLPRRPYGIVFSVQSLHHLPHEVQRELATHVYDTLDAGGVVLLQDRVALDRNALDQVYASVWERLERLTPCKSGWSSQYFLERLEKKEDHPASIEEHLCWLRTAGFWAACLHLHLDRALFATVKIG